MDWTMDCFHARRKHYSCLSYHLFECLMACTPWTARPHSVSKTWQYTERSKVTGILIGFCFNSAAAGGGIWSAWVIPCSILWLMEPFIASGSDRSTRVTPSVDYCDKTPTWVKLASFSGSSLASWISTQSTMPPAAAMLYCKTRLICTWPLTSPLSAVFAHRSEVCLQIQGAHAIRNSNRWWDKHEQCYLLKNTAWKQSMVQSMDHP